MEKTLAELAELVGGTLCGSAEIKIKNVANLEEAGRGQITFAVEPHLEEARSCQAEAIVLPASIEEFPLPFIRVANPREAFITLTRLFTPALKRKKGISDKAYVGEDVKLGSDVTIMPFAVVDDNAEIGDGTVIYPHCYIGQYAKVGENSLIYSNVTIREFCEVGKNAIIHSSAVIGSDGFGFVTKEKRHLKVPQVGNVVVEDDVEIGAQTAIDRAAMGTTRIKKGTKIDNLVHIGHGCVIGENNLIVAQTGISGSTKVGNNVTFGGQCGVVGHINIGSNSLFAARSGIINNTADNVFFAGFPARPHGEWLKNTASLARLSKLNKKVHELEKRIANLTKDTDK